MKKLMFLMFALVMGFSASAQTLPDVKVENQEGKVISIRELAILLVRLQLHPVFPYRKSLMQTRLKTLI